MVINVDDVVSDPRDAGVETTDPSGIQEVETAADLADGLPLTCLAEMIFMRVTLWEVNTWSRKWAARVLGWFLVTLQYLMLYCVGNVGSFYSDPYANVDGEPMMVDGEPVTVSHAFDPVPIYLFMMVLFMWVFAFMAGGDFLDSWICATDINSDKVVGWPNFTWLSMLNPCACKENYHRNMLYISWTMNAVFMVVVGRIMASAVTVVAVVADSAAVYIILQADDILKDYLNKTGIKFRGSVGFYEGTMTKLRSGEFTASPGTKFVRGGPMVFIFFALGLLSFLASSRRS